MKVADNKAILGWALECKIHASLQYKTWDNNA